MTELQGSEAASDGRGVEPSMPPLTVTHVLEHLYSVLSRKDEPRKPNSIKQEV